MRGLLLSGSLYGEGSQMTAWRLRSWGSKVESAEAFKIESSISWTSHASSEALFRSV